MLREGDPSHYPDVGATFVARNSASRSKLVSHPAQVFKHQSCVTKPECCSVRRVPPSICSSKKVTVVCAPRALGARHVYTSLRGGTISRNSPSRTNGRPLPTPVARQWPPTLTSPAHVVVVKTPGLTHHSVIWFETKAWKTRSEDAASSTLPETEPSERSATARAWLSGMLPTAVRSRLYPAYSVPEIANRLLLFFALLPVPGGRLKRLISDGFNEASGDDGKDHKCGLLSLKLAIIPLRRERDNGGPVFDGIGIDGSPEILVFRNIIARAAAFSYTFL